jgi:hypothetical protein
LLATFQRAVYRRNQDHVLWLYHPVFREFYGRWTSPFRLQQGLQIQSGTGIAGFDGHQGRLAGWLWRFSGQHVWRGYFQKSHWKDKVTLQDQTGCYCCRQWSAIQRKHCIIGKREFAIHSWGAIKKPFGRLAGQDIRQYRLYQKSKGGKWRRKRDTAHSHIFL